MPKMGYDSAMTVLIVIAALQLASTLILLLMFARTRSYLRDKESEIVDFLHNLFLPAGEKPSHFSELVDGIAQIFSNRIVTSFNAAIRGSAGGAAKAEGEAAMAANPLLGLLGRGKLGKNPLALAALSLIGSKFAPGPGGTAGIGAVPGNGHSPKFHL